MVSLPITGEGRGEGLLLFCCRSLSLFSCFFLCNLFLVSLYCWNLAFLLLSIGFLISLLYLTLFDTLADSAANNAEDKLDRLCCIIVCWDDKVNVAWVRVGVHDSEHWDAQTVSLAHCDVLLHHVNHEEG